MAEVGEKSGVHLTGADSGWPVAADAEPDPKKDGTGADPHSRASEVAGGVFEINERQSVDVDATGGTFTLTYDGQTTGAIAFNAAASAVKTALEALPNIEADDVLVAGGPGKSGGGSPYYITFQGTLAEQDVAEVTADGANLTGGGASATVGTVTPGS